MIKHLTYKPFLASILLLSLFVSACQYFNKEYTTLPESDLIGYVGTLPENQQRQIAQSQQARKGMIDQFKKMYAFAQAALAEGLDKGEEYSKTLTLETAKVLAQEHGKRNESFQVSKADIDGYMAAHQKDFDADMAFFTKNNPNQPTGEQLEGLKASWGELQFRAEKAKQAGLEKDPLVQMQLKMMRANLLANLYSKKVEEQFKPKDEDVKKYYAEHPEADPEKVKERMGGLLTRIKNGETFEKIADEINEDGTKGQGGDLQWFGSGMMDPDFEKAAFALQPGQVSQEPVKSSFGYHLIKVEGRRKSEKKPALPPGTPGSNLSDVAGAKNADGNAEEVHAKHIYLSTKAAEDILAQQSQDKIKRAMEDATIKYPVKAPEDFKVTVAGMRQPGSNALPAPGSGESGSMKMIDPNEKK